MSPMNDAVAMVTTGIISEGSTKLVEGFAHINERGPLCVTCGSSEPLVDLEGGPHVCQACKAGAAEPINERSDDRARNEHRGSRRVHVVKLPDCMKK
jgi:hypothetical protein